MGSPSDQEIILGLGEDLPVGLWIARAPNGEHVYVNRAFTEIMGMDARPDTVAGGYSGPYGIFTRDGAPYPEHRLPFVRALEERGVVVVDDITIRRRDGSKVDVRAFARPVGDPPTHVIIAFFDITREIEADHARAELDRQLRLAQRLESIGTLAGGIAHDFNNLTFGIKLLASELLADEAIPERRAALQLIDEITERSAKLTQSLLTFARRGKPRAAPISIDALLDAMSELLRRTQGGVRLELELGAGERGVVLADASRLEQVVMNLVVNAREAMGDVGRIIVRTRLASYERPPLALGAAKPGRFVVLEVSDDGPGIPPEIRERIFEPYFTTKTKGPQRGTGLGLATVLGIVESHGGACELDVGLEGRGATVRVLLPVTESPVAPIVVEPRARVPTGNGPLLVVDDDPIVRRALCAVLVRLGYTPVEAASGAEAIALFRERSASLRAVILDLVMPEMSGKATYLRLRELAPEIPVILMSGDAPEASPEELLALGVRAYIAKPYRVEDLASALAEHALQR